MLAGQPASVSRASTFALHRWAILTVLAMFPLIWFGGLTTSHGAGMAVPDWPNTYGYNMFAVPWDIWLGESAGGIFFEHTHRLLGSLTGLFALAAALAAWAPSRNWRARRWWGAAAVVLAVAALANFVAMRVSNGGAVWLGHLVSVTGGGAVISLLGWLARSREPRRWVRWTATALLGAVIMQGVLGGLRVTEVNLNLAIVHGIFAQITLCLAGFLVLVTGRWWARAAAEEPVVPQHERARARRLLIACGTLTMLIFGQLVIAAMMRHYGAGLAVPDFPLSYGRLVPPVSPEGLGAANEQRIFELRLPATTLGQIWLHSAHRIGAVLVTAGAVWVLWSARGFGRRGLVRHVALVAGLLIVQISLGIATVLMVKPADVATAHVAVGALLLLVSWLLTVRVARQYGAPSAPLRFGAFAASMSPAVESVRHRQVNPSRERILDEG